jgi:hypothetical protein
MNNDMNNVIVPAAMLSRLLDSAAELADYVAEEGRGLETGIMVARETMLEAAGAITAEIMGGRGHA